MKKQYGIYWAAFKIILKKDNKFLFLKTSQRGILDLPGGRADIDEGKKPIKKIIEREITEELGSEVKYNLSVPVLQYRRYSPKYKIYVLITAYLADYISGEIKLSQEHQGYLWIDPKNYKFRREDFSSQEAFLAFEENLSKF
jgi:8-oxo-dGTP diphosphatase